MDLQSFDLGPYSVHPSRNVIGVDGKEIGVEPKAMEVLVHLAAHPGDVLDKESIIKAVWPDTFVSDDVLTHAISHLRKVLDDDPAEPRFIQTVHRRGYRLVAPVVREPVQQVVPAPSRRRWVPVALGVTLASLIGAAAYLIVTHQGPIARVELVNPRAVTTALGVEDYPTWRPDGTQLAYESQQAGNLDIWVTGANGGTPVNLTADHAGDDRWPSWSPDGSQIAFWSDRDGGGYFAVPALGGKPRKLLAEPGNLVRPGPPQWSPDGQELAYARGPRTGGPYTIEIISVHGGRSRRYTLSLEAITPGFSLKWSPDGRLFAYATAIDLGSTASKICIFRLSDRKIFDVSDGKTLDWNPTWSSDGRSLYFVSNRGGSMDLWQHRLTPEGAPSGSPESLTTGLELRYAVFSPDGKRLAYSKGQDISNIWRVPALSDRLITWADARQLTSGQSGLDNLSLSPDVKHLAFTLFRDGRRHLWLLPVGGGEPNRLTTHAMNQVWSTWSPDGSAVAFHSVEADGEGDIWVAPAAGSSLRQLTRAPGRDLDPDWAPFGGRIAFNSNRTGNWDVWVVSVETGEERQLTTDKGIDFERGNAWSPDGREIVFRSNRKGTEDIWIVSVEDRKERQLTSEPGNEFDPRWSPTGEWIVYFSGGRLWRVRPSGGDRTPLPVGSHAVFWSRDGKKSYFHLTHGGLGGLEDIYEQSAEGGLERQLTDLKGKYGTLGAVSTDGHHFYFSWLERVGDLWVMDVKTRK